MTLTNEQQQALDELMALVPREEKTLPEDLDMQKLVAEKADFFKTWLGVSSSDLKSAFLALLKQKDGYEKRILDWVEGNPMDATIELLGAASWAFYITEKDQNPRIKTYIDALYYITTCASVGYADIFAVTQTGRAIAALIMTIGPSLTNMTLNRPI